MENAFGRIEVPPNLDTLPDTTLVDFKLEVDTRVREVKNEIMHARRRYASGGVPARLDWMRRAELFVCINGKLSQRIQHILSRRNEERKKKSHWPYVFQQVAKDTLPKTVYQTLVDETNKRTLGQPTTAPTPEES